MNASIETLGGEQLAAVAALWKQQQRRITTSFRGVSMLPTIPPGAPLEIVCDDQARQGDVVVILHRGEVVVHRLVVLRGDWMLTRGDANDVPDFPVSREAFVGRVAGLCRDNAVADVPGWVESVWQKRNLRLVRAAWNAGMAPARAVVKALWFVAGAVAKVQGAWRLYSPAGFLALLWSRSGGRLIDFDLVLTGRFPPPSVFEPVQGYRYERVEPDTPRWSEAMRMLHLDPSKRTGQHAYLAIDERDGSVAACTLADFPAGPVGFNRGGTADPRHRGRSLTGSVLLFQAMTLAREGVREVEYHVNVTNRGARKMHRKIGAREIDCWWMIVLLRRFRFARRVPFATPRVPNPS